MVGLRHALVAVAALGAAAILGCNDNKLTAGAGEGVGAIAGQVCAPSGNMWLSSAHVWVLQADQTTIDDTFSDVNGNFLLQGVDAGTRTLNVQKGSFSTQETVNVVAGQTTTLPAATCVQGASAHVAVITGNDSIQNILASAGITDVTLYGSGTGAAGTASALLGNPTLLASYDIVFINCGDFQSSMFAANYVSNIAAYVQAGGSLYVSDWAYDFIDTAFPGEIHFYGNDTVRKAARAGQSGMVTGTPDAALAAALGHSTISLNYSLGQWAVALTAAPDAKVLVTGTISTKDPSSGAINTVSDAPLALEFKKGTGSVVFTSFHNETQATADMGTALAYMVFQL